MPLVPSSQLQFLIKLKSLLCTSNSSMTAYDKTNIPLNKKNVVLVRPAEPTSSQVLSLSTLDNDYNLELLCQTLYVYKSNISSSDSNDRDDENGNSFSHKDPALVVKEALSRALVYYYPLAGKLKRQADGRLQITCTSGSDGVPFLEAIANPNLASLNYFDGIDVETGKQFVFDWPIDSQFGYHPLVIQVTKFSCGGFTIGMGLSHSVCDGFGAAQFFHAMTELANGKSEPTVKPVWERERLVGKPTSELPLLVSQLVLDKASLATSPFLPTSELSHACFNVNDESIRRLKMHLNKESTNSESSNPNGSFTTLEVLGAYVWRSRYRALKQNKDGKTLFCLAMGIRNLIYPPLTEGYYGNAFVSANVELLGKELEDGPLSRVAELIMQSKKMASTNEHIWKSLNILEVMRQEKMKTESNNGASLILTDWRQLRLLEEEDFGWNASVNMIPLPWNIFGYVDLCIFMPPCRINTSMEGGTCFSPSRSHGEV